MLYFGKYQTRKWLTAPHTEQSSASLGFNPLDFMNRDADDGAVPMMRRSLMLDSLLNGEMGREWKRDDGVGLVKYKKRAYDPTTFDYGLV